MAVDSSSFWCLFLRAHLAARQNITKAAGVGLTGGFEVRLWNIHVSKEFGSWFQLNDWIYI
jgi:hypothetical protein